jgi:hypothetical protein
MSYANGASIQAVANVRDIENEIISETVLLEDLNSQTHFDGEYFKIVYKDTEEIIAIDPLGIDKTSLRAATAYYHLNLARKYYSELGFEQDEKITIRIGIDKDFSKKNHFLLTPHEKLYNNAHTINSGAGNAATNTPAWGKEIWYRDPKAIKLSEQQLEGFKRHIENMLPTPSSRIDSEVIIYILINSAISADPEDYIKVSGKGIAQNYLANALIRFIVPELTILISENEFLLDTALIPEVHYHEYSHFMMTDYIPTVENTPLLEGLCDYFATKISRQTTIADSLGEYGQLISKRDSKNKLIYNYQFDLIREETLGPASAYVLSTLSQIENYLLRYESPADVERMIFKLRKVLTINSKIKKDLPTAILKVTHPRYKIGILAILNRSGL